MRDAMREGGALEPIRVRVPVMGTRASDGRLRVTVPAGGRYVWRGDSGKCEEIGFEMQE